MDWIRLRSHWVAGAIMAVLGFVGGAAYKNLNDTYFSYGKLTLDQHRFLLDVFKFHADVRKADPADKSGYAARYIVVLTKTGALPEDVGAQVASLLADDTPGAETKAAVAAAIGSPAPTDVPSPEGGLSGRLFVQASAESQRAFYEAIRQAVTTQSATLAVPALEVVSYSGLTELRYFLPDDKDQANKVLALVRQKMASVRCVHVRGYEKKGVKPGLFELWIGPAGALGTDTATTVCPT